MLASSKFRRRASSGVRQAESQRVCRVKTDITKLATAPPFVCKLEAGYLVYVPTKLVATRTHA
eukprot:6186349-Pleurochrysis_carterae.AAC.2